MYIYIYASMNKSRRRPALIHLLHIHSAVISVVQRTHFFLPDIACDGITVSRGTKATHCERCHGANYIYETPANLRPPMR